MERLTRKKLRLENYDYSRNGEYFVTVCTKNKQHLFWDYTKRVGGDAHIRPSNYRQLCGQMQTTAPTNTKQNKFIII